MEEDFEGFSPLFPEDKAFEALVQELLPFPKKRSLPWKVGYKQRPKATLSHRRTLCLRAGYVIATRGWRTISPCETCLAGNGPFDGCYASEYGCANCRWSQLRCPLDSGPKKTGWTGEEDKQLLDLRKTHTWIEISTKLSSRTPGACEERFRRLTKTPFSSIPSTTDSDNISTTSESIMSNDALPLNNHLQNSPEIIKTTSPATTSSTHNQDLASTVILEETPRRLIGGPVLHYQPKVRELIWQYAFDALAPGVVSILSRLAEKKAVEYGKEEGCWKVRVESIRVALLQVCQESRALGLQKYTPLGFSERPIYADLTRDIVFFPYAEKSNIKSAIDLVGDNRKLIQRVAIDFKYCALDPAAYIFLRRLPQLQELMFVVNASPGAERLGLKELAPETCSRSIYTDHQFMKGHISANYNDPLQYAGDFHPHPDSEHFDLVPALHNWKIVQAYAVHTEHITQVYEDHQMRPYMNDMLRQLRFRKTEEKRRKRMERQTATKEGSSENCRSGELPLLDAAGCGSEPSLRWGSWLSAFKFQFSVNFSTREPHQRATKTSHKHKLDEMDGGHRMNKRRRLSS